MKNVKNRGSGADLPKGREPFPFCAARGKSRLHYFYGTEVFLHGLERGGIFPGCVPMAFGILAHQLHGQKASANDAGIVIGPELTGGTVTVSADHDARKV